jgi:hypothetical protein
MAATNIGMMDGAYFVGRNEILAWINTTLQLGLSKVEEVSDASRPVPFRSRCWGVSRSSPFAPVWIRRGFLGWIRGWVIFEPHPRGMLLCLFGSETEFLKRWLVCDLAGGVGRGGVSVDGRGAPGGGAHAQGQLRRQDGVRHDPELQSAAGCFQQAQNYQGENGFVPPSSPLNGRLYGCD